MLERYPFSDVHGNCSGLEGLAFQAVCSPRYSLRRGKFFQGWIHHHSLGQPGSKVRCLGPASSCVSINSTATLHLCVCFYPSCYGCLGGIFTLRSFLGCLRTVGLWALGLVIREGHHHWKTDYSSGWVWEDWVSFLFFVDYGYEINLTLPIPLE